MQQLTTKQLYDNARMNALSKRRQPARSPATEQLTYDAEAMITARFNQDLTPEMTIRRARRQHTSLHQAVIRGDFNAVAQLITDDNIDLATVNGLTPLHLAVFGLSLYQKAHENMRAKKSVQEQIVDLLLEAGAPVDVWDSMNRLPAAMIVGGTLPASLVHAMERVMERTTKEEKSKTYGAIHAFFDQRDVDGDLQAFRFNTNNKWCGANTDEPTDEFGDETLP